MVSKYQVRDIVPKKLVTIEESKTVQAAARLMRDEKRGDVIVVDAAGVPVGILTERDVTHKVAALGLPSGEVSVKSIMSSPILMIAASNTVDEAIQLMIQKSVHRLLVLDGEKHIGLLTETDIVGSHQKCGYCFKELSHAPGEGEAVITCSCHTKYHQSCTQTIVYCVYCSSMLVKAAPPARPEDTTAG